jgi:hypothetical protein
MRIQEILGIKTLVRVGYLTGVEVTEAEALTEVILPIQIRMKIGGRTENPSQVIQIVQGMILLSLRSSNPIGGKVSKSSLLIHQQIDQGGHLLLVGL